MDLRNSYFNKIKFNNNKFNYSKIKSKALEINRSKLQQKIILQLTTIINKIFNIKVNTLIILCSTKLLIRSVRLNSSQHFLVYNLQIIIHIEKSILPLLLNNRHIFQIIQILIIKIGYNNNQSIFKSKINSKITPAILQLITKTKILIAKLFATKYK